MSTPAASPIPKTKRRFVTSLTMIIGVLALIFGITVAGMVSSQPANAAIWDFCKADQTFAGPLPSGGIQSGGVDAQVQKVGDHDLSWVASTDTPAAAYEGAGMTWYTFGASCADFPLSGTTMIGNFLFQVFSLFPAKMLGVLMQIVFGLTTFISGLIIGDGADKVGVLGPILNRLHKNMFTQWAPLLISAGLVGALWNVARKRGQKGVGDFGWLIGVIVGIGLLTSPDGINLVRQTNDAVSSMTVCATLSVSGACVDSDDTNAFRELANSMTETLSAGTWAAGAIGDLSNKPFTETVISFVAHDGKPKIYDDNGDGSAGKTLHVPIPLGAIPASGTLPTWGDVWRWTQTYTRSEMAAMNTHSNLRCSDDNSPKIESLSNKDDHDISDGNRSELCTYKWIVRAAMTSYMVEHYPGSYQDMTGSGNLRIIAAIAGVGMLPVGWGIGIVGLMVLFYQLEFIGLILISPLVALVSLRNPAAAKKWGGQVSAALVKQVATGLVLGIILFLVGQITAQFVNASTGPLGLNVIPPYMVPFVSSCITVLVMIMGFVMLGRVRDMILGGMNLPEGDKVTGGLKKVALGGIAATSGALAAGSGLRLAGAGKALVRSGAIGGGTVRNGIMAGGRAGKSVKAKQESQARATEREQERIAAHLAAEDRDDAKQAKAREAFQRQAPVMTNGTRPDAVNEAFTPGPPEGSSPEVRALWDRLMRTSAATVRWDEQVAPLRAQRDRTADAMRRAQESLDRFDQTRSDRVDAFADKYIAEGRSAPEARDLAEMDVAKSHTKLTLTVRHAEQAHTEADISLQHVLDGPSDWAMAAQDHAARSTDMTRSIESLHLQDAQERDLFLQYTSALRMQRPDPDGSGSGDPFWP